MQFISGCKVHAKEEKTHMWFYMIVMDPTPPHPTCEAPMGKVGEKPNQPPPQPWHLNTRPRELVASQSLTQRPPFPVLNSVTRSYSSS